MGGTAQDRQAYRASASPPRQARTRSNSYPLISPIWWQSGEQFGLKPTQASAQAGHWYAHALFKAIRLRDANPRDTVAMAFPDFGRYRNLLAETRRSLAALHIDAFLVAEAGDVHRWSDR